MSNNVKEEYRSIRGMCDILPTDVGIWDNVEAITLKLMARYGYEQIRLPLLEKTALFQRAIGEVTDIVEKEMFSFVDEKKRSLSLRPEGTASCVRSCLEHGLLRSLPQKLWYQGPMFRYEAPQKGRNRQFHQLGVECFGVSNCEAEVEQIAMFSRLWLELGLHDAVQLEINNLGTYDERNQYAKDLVIYLKKHYDQLDPDCQRRLQINPLRILDSKNPEIQVLLEGAPRLFDYLGQSSLDGYNLVKDHLRLLGINYQENHKIVRGLDYYTGIVWEWTTKLLGSQSAVGAGGRYDNLVNQLGGLAVPAVGLAIGIERVILLMKQKAANISQYIPHGYLICVGTASTQSKFVIAEKIRNICGNFNLKVDLSGGSFKNQFKRADKSGAEIALVIGDDEINTDSITIKYLRNSSADSAKDIFNQQQLTVKIEDLYKYLIQALTI
jgi:histidyl-tRNA synthetase